ANAAKTAAIDTANTHTTTEINKVLNQGSSTAAGAFSIGKDAQATGEASTATGTGSKATGANSVALGANSVADKDNDVSIGGKILNKVTGLWDDFTRTLSGVTDGTDAHDAVNKGQLDTAKTAAVTEAKGYTDTTANAAKTAAIAAANTHTDTGINNALQTGKAYIDNAKAEAIAYTDDTTTRAMNRVAESGRPGGTYAGTDSYAAGKESKATGVNSVALGANSRATRNNEVNIGSWVFKPDESDKQPAPKPQFRSGTFIQGKYEQSTRILSGVSDGEKDDEAVNRKQLNDVASTANRAAATAKDEAVRDANKYTDEARLKANEKVLKEANTYTDDTAKKTLKTANEHTERRAVVAENNAVTRSNAYTDESSSRTLERANTYTNHRSAQAENNAVARSNAYTDNRFGELRKSLQHTEKRLNAGIAGVTAISSIPYAAGNKFSYGIGAGNYQNGNAIAAGVQFRVSQSANVRLNVSWDSAGNNATGVGIAGGW
ncbi:hypothetical protein DN342_26175, partial [Salmonella enterica subsp. enterica serovar Enteritidis]|nr:hypothetical protein [Salmonella enterica subsp. enterica serovar Enteritidis]EGX1470295.1 hypothetical protein [Salmonella enterica]